MSKTGWEGLTDTQRFTWVCVTLYHVSVGFAGLRKVVGTEEGTTEADTATGAVTTAMAVTITTTAAVSTLSRESDTTLHARGPGVVRGHCEGFVLGPCITCKLGCLD